MSPVGDSQANGEIYRAIRTVQGQVRTMKSAFEANFGLEFAENHPIIPWMISYASSLINKFRIDTDGKTAHERCRGRKFNRIVPQFGERIMYRKFQNKKERRKLEAQWESGVYRGVNESSQELIVGTPLGAIKTQYFRQKGSHAERWTPEEVSSFKGLP